MRWKISHHDHDTRQIDLPARAVLIVVIVAAWGRQLTKAEHGKLHRAEPERALVT